MGGYKLEISGIDELVGKLDVKKFEDDIQLALNDYILRVESEAKQLVPKDIGGGIGLAASITHDFEKLSGTISVNKDYAAYVEFGTGPFASQYVPSLPQEWQDYAAKFYVNGQGHTPAQPFLFPAIENQKALLKKDLEHLIT
jgi:HK97 gp10 family phage protein